MRTTNGFGSMTHHPTHDTVLDDGDGRSVRGNTGAGISTLFRHDENAAPEHAWTAYIESGSVSVKVTAPTKADLTRRMRAFSETLLKSWTNPDR